jgi:hypothetical protein
MVKYCFEGAIIGRSGESIVLPLLYKLTHTAFSCV